MAPGGRRVLPEFLLAFSLGPRPGRARADEKVFGSTTGSLHQATGPLCMLPAGLDRQGRIQEPALLLVVSACSVQKLDTIWSDLAGRIRMGYACREV